LNTTDVDLDLNDLPWRRSALDKPEDFSDMLATLFAGQEKLAEQYWDIERRNGGFIPHRSEWGDLDSRMVQVALKDMMWRVTEELGEAANCLKNKPWKNTFAATDVEHFHEEIADALHFFIELCIFSGITAEELFLRYFKKHIVNSFRQETNY
jgi:NTP pyrophosphatase (non-canonical NTP hydrolase)